MAQNPAMTFLTLGPRGEGDRLRFREPIAADGRRPRYGPG